MPATVIPFPSQLVGLQPNDQIAQVIDVDHGRALTIKPFHRHQLATDLPVFAHNDLIMELQAGDWVRFTNTQYGPVLIDRLASPGQKPLPRIHYQNGNVDVDPNDPVWRLYE